MDLTQRTNLKLLTDLSLAEVQYETTTLTASQIREAIVGLRTTLQGLESLRGNPHIQAGFDIPAQKTSVEHMLTALEQALPAAEKLETAASESLEVAEGLVLQQSAAGATPPPPPPPPLGNPYQHLINAAEYLDAKLWNDAERSMKLFVGTWPAAISVQDFKNVLTGFSFQKSYQDSLARIQAWRRTQP